MVNLLLSSGRGARAFVKTEPKLADLLSVHEFPQLFQQVMFLETTELLEQDRIRDEHFKNASPQCTNPRVLGPRVPDSRAPGVLQMFLTTHSSDSPPGDQFAQDISYMLSSTPTGRAHLGYLSRVRGITT